MKKLFPKTYWLQTRGVERLLGTDRSKVRRMMRLGEVPFVRDHRGTAQFPRKEIEEMAQARGRIVGVPPGPVAAKAFALFAQGKTWQEVVIILGQLGMAQPVEVVMKLHEQFLDLDKGSSSGTMPRGSKRASRPELEEDTAHSDDAPQVPDVEDWQREQADIARRAQASLDQEQREWDESQRKRAEEIARIPRPQIAKASSPEKEAGPLSDRLATVMQMLAGNRRGS